MRRYLIVGNQTLGSEELRAAVRERLAERLLALRRGGTVTVRGSGISGCPPRSWLDA